MTLCNLKQNSLRRFNLFRNTQIINKKFLFSDFWLIHLHRYNKIKAPVYSRREKVRETERDVTQAKSNS